MTSQQETLRSLPADNEDTSVLFKKETFPRRESLSNDVVSSEISSFQQHKRIDKGETKRLTGIVQDELKFFLREKLLTPTAIEQVIIEQLSDTQREYVEPYYQESKEAFRRWREASYDAPSSQYAQEQVSARWQEYLTVLEATAEATLALLPTNDYGNLKPAMNFFIRDLSLFGSHSTPSQEQDLQSSYQELVDSYRQLFPDHKRFCQETVDMLRELSPQNEREEILEPLGDVDTYSELCAFSKRMKEWESAASYRIDSFQERYEAVRSSEERYDKAHQACTVGNWPLAAKFAKDSVEQFALPASDLPELFAAACMGLTRASRNFDPSSGHAFSTYAVWDIQKEISMAARQIKEKVYMPRRISELMGSIDRAEKSYMNTNGDLPTEEVLFSQLSGMASQEALQNAFHARKQNSFSLSDSSNDVVRDEVSSRGSCDTSCEQNDLRDVLNSGIQNALANLSEREKNIVMLRFGLSDKAEAREHMPVEIAGHYGLARQRIHQILKKVLLQLQEDEALIALNRNFDS